MACYTPYGIISSGQCQYKSEAKVPFHQFLSTYRHIRLCNHVIHNLFLVVFKSLATPDYIFKCKFSSYMILKNQL